MKNLLIIFLIHIFSLAGNAQLPRAFNVQLRTFLNDSKLYMSARVVDPANHIGSDYKSIYFEKVFTSGVSIVNQLNELKVKNKIDDKKFFEIIERLTEVQSRTKIEFFTYNPSNSNLQPSRAEAKSYAAYEMKRIRDASNSTRSEQKNTNAKPEKSETLKEVKPNEPNKKSTGSSSSSQVTPLGSLLLEVRQLKSVMRRSLGSEKSQRDIKIVLKRKKVFYDKGGAVVELFNQVESTITSPDIKRAIIKDINHCLERGRLKFATGFNNGKFLRNPLDFKNYLSTHYNIDMMRASYLSLTGPKTWGQFKANASDKLRKTREKINSFSAHFGRQLRDFSIATLGLGALSAFSQENPIGLEQAINQSLDPIGIGSFGFFVAGSLVTTNYINKKLKPQKFIPKQLTSYSGMVVGSLLSTVIHELIIDHTSGDFSSCRDGDYEACDRAHEKWFSRDKYAGYIPLTGGLVAAAAGAGSITAAASFGSKVTVQILERKKALKALATFKALTPTGMFLTVGNFFIFLKVHKYTGPIVKETWNNLNFNYLGWSQSDELKSDKDIYSQFSRTKVSNDEYMNWLDEGLQNPEEFQAYASSDQYLNCLANSRLELSPLARSRAGARASNIEDPKKIFDCNLRYSPEKIIKTDYAFNKEKNNLILENFQQRQLNWQLLVGNFSETYELSKSLYEQVFNLKNNKDSELVLSNNNELDIINLRKYVQSLSSSEGERIIKEHYPTNKDYIEALKAKALLDKQREDNSYEDKNYRRQAQDARFGHIADFIIYSMACGPDLEGKSEGTIPLEVKSENIAEVKFIKNSFGSSLEFLPPKVTLGSRKICSSIQNQFLNTAVVNRGSSLDTIENKLNNRNDVFVGPWFDENGKRYDNLSQYVFENLDPKLVALEKESQEGFQLWDQKILPSTEDVWQNFDDAYVQLIKKYLLPTLINIDFAEEKTPCQKLKNRNCKTFNKLLYSQKVASHEKSRYLNKSYTRAYNAVERVKKLVHLSRLVSTQKDKQDIENKFNTYLTNFHGVIEHHKAQLHHWNNNINFYESEDIEEDVLGLLVEPLNEIKSILFDQEMGNYVEIPYSADVLYEAASGSKCDWQTLSWLQDELEIVIEDIELSVEVKSPFRKLVCNDSEYAKARLKALEKQNFYAIILEQGLHSLIKETIDYLQLVLNLTNTIGYKKQGD